MKRYYFKLTKNDLKWLAKRAVKEHWDFFKRNSHLRKSYFRSLVGIALCQGAALHYLNKKNGIKDFDIWLFYKENERVNLLVRRPVSDTKGYKGIKIDFMRRAIPAALCKKPFSRQDECILNYLQERNTATKKFLLQKAVVGLYPAKILAKVIWPTNSSRRTRGVHYPDRLGKLATGQAKPFSKLL